MFGFKLDRINGSHHIFTHPDIQELINLQDYKGHVKPCQIKQLIQIIEKYNLRLEE
jgi:predicted RNA binding protein YcfA (HicA-like mRNA interferase family)